MKPIDSQSLHEQCKEAYDRLRPIGASRRASMLRYLKGIENGRRSYKVYRGDPSFTLDAPHEADDEKTQATEEAQRGSRGHVKMFLTRCFNLGVRLFYKC